MRRNLAEQGDPARDSRAIGLLIRLPTEATPRGSASPIASNSSSTAFVVPSSTRGRCTLPPNGA